MREKIEHKTAFPITSLQVIIVITESLSYHTGTLNHCNTLDYEDK